MAAWKCSVSSDMSDSSFAYWNRLTLRNPQLRDDGAMMRLTVAAFRKAVENAYLAGRNDAAADCLGNPETAARDFLGGLFGKRR